MSRGVHIIRRQVLEIRVSDEDAAYAHSHRLSRLYREQLLPVLERVFDEFAAAGETVRLARLEVDLGVISPHAPDAEIARQLAEKLPAVLAEHLAGARRTNGKPAPAGPDGVPPPAFRDATARTLELLEHYLGSGTLPWWASPSEWAEWVAALPDTIARAPQRFREWLRTVLPDRSKRRRLIYQFPTAVLQALAESARVDWQEVERAQRDLRTVFASLQRRGARDEILPVIRELALLFALRAEISVPVLHRAVQEISGELLPAAGSSPRARRAALREKLRQHPPAGALRTWLAARLADAEDAPAVIPPPAAPSSSGVVNESRESTDEAIFVENAGLVLTAPFLAGFFTNLGMMREGRFVSEKAQVRAVHLLQYVATATEEAPEYALPLNKILCGWPLTRPLPASLRLRDREKRESQALLESIIRHWAVLKNTSVPGLQTAFLQRNGLLHREENGWRLQVERRAYDLLLERLPWQISLIRNSWMEGLLRVEW